jgi:replicative DNA helicase
MTPDDEPHFMPAQDDEAVQAVVLAAAIQGDEACRGQLPLLHQGFEEPYRTVAVAVIEQMLGGGFVDPNTVRVALSGKKLARRDASGKIEQLTAKQAINLIFAGPVATGQADAYLQVLRDQIDAKRRAEFRERAQETAKQYGEDPERLLREVESLVTDARRDTRATYLSEALRFIPYFQGLMQLQKGTSFLGLDCGFPLLNGVANGMDTGLWVIAAPPSAGKTTFVWQICQQAARLNKVPVLFVSMEQSEQELRVKALARLSKINSRHIARGRLRSDDPQDIHRLQQAAREYFHVGRHLTIIPGDDTTTIDAIGAAAASLKARSGSDRCLVAIDYLQILPLGRADTGRVTSAKDRVDLHVSALRRLARQLDSPVVAISAENRAGYKSKQLDVFKESGGIEYSADIAGVMTLDKVATRAASGNHRVVDLNIIKNRNGELGVVKFKFYPERAEFVESGKGDLPTLDDGDER